MLGAAKLVSVIEVNPGLQSGGPLLPQGYSIAGGQETLAMGKSLLWPGPGL